MLRWTRWIGNWKWVVLAVMVLALLSAQSSHFGVSAGMVHRGSAAPGASGSEIPRLREAGGRSAATDTGLPHVTRLPLVLRNYGELNYRLGYGAGSGSIGRYAEIKTLKAGWYLDWGVRSAPSRPDGMEYAQVIRLHQKLACDLWSRYAWDRVRCPYAEPHDYLVSPSLPQIEFAIRANPGSLWIIGNEMDRRDWAIPGTSQPEATGGQDEMLPELYAVAFHDLESFIKGIDPTAQVAIGGVIQATPLRLEYLTKVWDSYLNRYGTPMPVDVWNVHNFILKEVLNDFGASIPPGSSAQVGVTYENNPDGDGTHVSMVIFDQQIRAFRAWMKAHNQQDKPLIVSEYGVLYSHIAQADTAAEVQNFMVQTFDYFLGTADPALGFGGDGGRLVQRWAWYSLDDIGLYTLFNAFGALFDPVSGQITSTGVRFREYSLANKSRLAGWQ